jgi:hypothetical protein
MASDLDPYCLQVQIHADPDPGELTQCGFKSVAKSTAPAFDGYTDPDLQHWDHDKRFSAMCGCRQRILSTILTKSTEFFSYRVYCAVVVKAQIKSSFLSGTC